ncbi:minor tail protein [Pseudomonas phage MiCath]|uniref:Minor tail protein n=1 Tax=Pseudomonas phage MiCath TaxID=3003729 RepID=A0AAE9VFF7_9CAUD|nr:minor tail protein [Pseudomonas phage MiCath]WAX22426.1 minor tail protein [Pseudomonas phage MiCath]
MSFVNLLFGGNRSTVIGSLQLDALVEESFSFSAALTEHAVEYGSDTTDHIRDLADTLEIEGSIGDAGVSILDTMADILDGATNTLNTYNPFTPDYKLGAERRTVNNIERLPTAGRSRLLQAIDVLYAAKVAKLPVTVITGMRYYDGFYITNVKCTRSNRAGGMLDISVSLRTLRVAEMRSGTLPYPQQAKDDKTKQKTAKTNVNKGRAEQKTVSTATQSKVDAVIFLEN